MKRIIAVLIVGLLSLALPVIGNAATCSCAGVPLLSAIDTSSTEPGGWFINFSSEDHVINDLVLGDKEIKDETRRKRSSLSQAVSATYGIADGWSISGLVSYMEHSREVGRGFFGEQTSSGLGDGVILLRYTPRYITPFSRHEISLGIGARIPIGKDDAGGVIVFSEDMQPSVGAVGEILWTSYSYAFNQAATIQLNASANYTRNDDENDRGYAFGDEFNFALGISQSIGTKFGYAAGFRYRTTNADERNSFEIPNTGGEWLDFIPAVQYAVTDDLNIALSGRVTVKRRLDGAVQFSTSYSYALSFTYGF
jgi:hypothetical protein